MKLIEHINKNRPKQSKMKITILDLKKSIPLKNLETTDIDCRYINFDITKSENVEQLFGNAEFGKLGLGDAFREVLTHTVKHKIQEKSSNNIFAFSRKADKNHIRTIFFKHPVVNDFNGLKREEDNYRIVEKKINSKIVFLEPKSKIAIKKSKRGEQSVLDRKGRPTRFTVQTVSSNTKSSPRKSKRSPIASAPIFDPKGRKTRFSRTVTIDSRIPTKKRSKKNSLRQILI